MVDMSRYSAEAWGRLGREVRKRRTALRMTQEQLAEAAGISLNTVTNVELGNTRPRDLTLTAICDALIWTADSALNVLEGGDPTVVVVEPDNDALRFQRPDKISDAAWEEIREQMAADFERYLRWRGR